ncbi:hypothetical protein THIOM_004980 [Candidatus Thiomargarita nelsonii]|uniref:Uncharacterized protein n=1 Tax=Candidatus Thiomargarita nelsonii TaxID=1003181 RepID=A0A0A6P0Q1_9GAMM|nr:hypothetical protein THIOM_004980 [Candidatus Thiomargarita nelsonii]
MFDFSDKLKAQTSEVFKTSEVFIARQRGKIKNMTSYIYGLYDPKYPNQLRYIGDSYHPKKG